MKTGVNSGAISIKAAVADGHLRSVQIVSSRPLTVSQLFIGRPADEAPVLAGRLFSLCGLSHNVAANLAVAAAKGQPMAVKPFSRAVLAERIGDYLRALVIGWPDAGIAGLLQPSEVVPVRDALAACRDLVTGSTIGSDRIRRVIDNLAILDGDSLLKRALGVLPDDQTLLAVKPDALTVDDDLAVIEAAIQQGEAFAANPYLPGRSVETGAYARCSSFVTPRGQALASRMEARLVDLVQAVHGLDAETAEVAQCGSPRTGQGYGVVESPRGRLYHWAKLDKAGMVIDYKIIAPTEWNFHPNGPFVSALLGAKLGTGEQAQKLVTWLAALFDPCVAFRVSVQENIHA